MKAIILGIVVTCILCGCSPNAQPNSSTPSSSTQSQSSSVSSNNESAYEAIFEDYSGKLRAATPGLLDEFYAEAATNEDGVGGLSRSSTSKMDKLAEISAEGIEEMAKVSLASGSGDSEEYEEWASKLEIIKTEESKKIVDEFLVIASSL